MFLKNLSVHRVIRSNTVHVSVLPVLSIKSWNVLNTLKVWKKGLENSNRNQGVKFFSGRVVSLFVGCLLDMIFFFFFEKYEILSISFDPVL